MVFSSFTFLWIFLPLTILGGFLFRRKGTNLFLLLASLFFYAWGEPKYVTVLLLSVTLNWAGGLLMERAVNHKLRRGIGATLILFNLALLGLFKYAGFFAATLNQLTGTSLIRIRPFALPIGISFYTFQSISYIADLTRERIDAQRSWVKLALYISFFPQLIAGPIVKYKDIADRLRERSVHLEDLSEGFIRFCFGLGKKVLIANELGSMVDGILSHPLTELSGGLLWAEALIYTLQIYFDFSGYSDMAIGLARAFGFHFQENFNHPYRSLSVREFWRRWHISLSTWFRDYLYIPLGGNRRGTARTIFNLWIVFFATGLWHGAQWNFVVWGLYHGAFLILERCLPTGLLERIPRPVRWVYAFTQALIGWVFFRADSLSAAWKQLRRMFTLSSAGVWTLAEFISPAGWVLIALAMLLSTVPTPQWRGTLGKRKLSDVLPLSLRAGNALLLLFLSIVMLANDTHNPFIYFRF